MSQPYRELAHDGTKTVLRPTPGALIYIEIDNPNVAETEYLHVWDSNSASVTGDPIHTWIIPPSWTRPLVFGDWMRFHTGIVYSVTPNNDATGTPAVDVAVNARTIQ